MAAFQDYHFTSIEQFARDAQKTSMVFLYVYEDPTNTSLIETIVAEPDELCFSVDLAKVGPAIRDQLLSLDAIGQKVYGRQKRDIPYVQTFVTGSGFFGTAFEPKEIERIISDSRAQKANIKSWRGLSES